VTARRQEPLWLGLQEVLALHDEQIMLFGGSPGLLKRGALEAVVARPPHVFHYDLKAGLADFAAIYLGGLINGHAFVDGNKRVGLATMLVFLARNGSALHVPPLELFDLVLGVATSRIREDAAADWLKQRLG
jgi:death-on-curing protein